MYTVVTLNGRGFMFAADEMVEIGDVYTFYYDDEKVAEFKKDAIAGYFVSHYSEEEDEENY